MPRVTGDELRQRDTGRDLNAELLDAIDDLEAGRLGRVTIVRGDQVIESQKSPKSLMRMLSEDGNPRADNLFALVSQLKAHEGVSLRVRASAGSA
jgi:hypothetical protein